MSVRGFRTGETGRAALLAAAVLGLLAWGVPARGGEAELLAERILAAECGDCLVFDRAERQQLAAGIGRALTRVRERRPDLAHIRARAALDPRALLVQAEPALLAALAHAPERKTGYAAFDALSDEFDLESVRVFSFADTALLRFAAPVNIAAAARAYREAEGVRGAEPDAVLGDGPDIAAARLGAVWHVVIDRAWGDCPSGCLRRETAFFTVSGADTNVRDLRLISGIPAVLVF